MLTLDEQLENRRQFVALLKKLDGSSITESETVVTNSPSARLLEYLESSRADFFQKPYNSYDTYAYAGSLCEQSLKFYAELTKLCELYAPGKYTEAEIIEVALLKNIYRAELYEFYKKNQKNEATKQWEAVTAVRTRETRPVFGEIGFSSYMITKKFISNLSDEVIEAICYSGMNQNTLIDSYNIRITYPLVSLATMAEFAAAYCNLSQATKE